MIAMSRVLRVRVPVIDDVSKFEIIPATDRNGNRLANKDTGAPFWIANVQWDWKSEDGSAAALLGQESATRVVTVEGADKPGISTVVAKLVEALAKEWSFEGEK